ncbi:MAG: hypothetical protein COB46_04105 [Rhodospirillaceae bacterium]|nr:MAG: hypothetical protein COB46_04105 [Rhodospirillaceae bacterium]
MSEPRLKSGFWVKAQLRLCDLAFLPCVVVKRGDEDAGQILIKINRLNKGCQLLAKRYTDDGGRAWTVVAGDDEQACDAYIFRESNMDADLWVLEIEDLNGTYQPDGQEPLLE